MEFIFRIHNYVSQFKLFFKFALVLTVLCHRGTHSHSALKKIIAHWRVDEGTKRLQNLYVWKGDSLHAVCTEVWEQIVRVVALLATHVYQGSWWF